ncbi:MAG: hypothetical protein Q4Q58_02105 [Thermoplasmata archaeon]|nr:hypothetical protein [Thermoplasmata archaeon]
MAGAAVRGRGDTFEWMRNGVRFGISRAVVLANYVLAAMMVVAGFSYLVRVFVGHTDFHWAYMLAYASFAVCGTLIFVDKRRSLPRSVGMFAIGLGLFRIFSGLTYYRPHSYINLFVLAMFILGANLVVTGVYYRMGHSRAREYMIYTTVIMFFVYLAILLYIILGDTSFLPMEFFGDYEAVITMLVIMYPVFILILDSETLRQTDWSEIHNKTLDSVRRTYYLDPEAAISRRDAETLMAGFGDRAGWISLHDGGPAECEIRLPIENKGRSVLIAQRWAGRDEMFVTMSDHWTGSIIQANRFAVVSAYIVDGHLTLNIPGGRFMRIAVKERIA